MNTAKIAAILNQARAEGRRALFETEGMALLDALGLLTPKFFVVKNAQEASLVLDRQRLPGDKVVVKVVSAEILHKSDVGGVKIVANTREAILATMFEMESRLKGPQISGFSVNQCIDYSGGIAGELIFGARWTEDYGAILNFGPGGIYAEFLAKNLKAGSELAVLSAEKFNCADAEAAIERTAISQIVCSTFRGQPPRASISNLTTVAEKLAALAREFMPHEIVEFEMNPMVTTDAGLVALDVLVKLGDGTAEKSRRQSRRDAIAERPVFKLKNLLEPRSVALIGVSEKMNPGHIILNNLIREGFDKKKIYIIKPDSQTIEGCRCVPDIRSLPERVDLLVLSIAASHVPQVVTDVVEHQKAESLIVIPGGLEEKKGSEAVVAKMNATLQSSRKTSWKGPIINGGNCLGVKSMPGHYDTMFIPQYKLGIEPAPVAPVALISQSGAFAISRTSNLSRVHPKYSITVGNQSDLTIGDYLEYLANDLDVEVYGVYVEGFKPLDGVKFLQAARKITESGRSVILYRAGRTAAGAQASASHTASIAGDYVVSRQLSRQAGVIIADSLVEFDDLVRLFNSLRGKQVTGTRVGAISNAGFECVAMGDNLGALTLARFESATTKRLEDMFASSRISEIVDIHNPLDLTPMAGDEGYEFAVKAVLDDTNVDAAVVACVPLTPALNTLLPSAGVPENLDDERSVVSRLGRIAERASKPMVAVVDAGTSYDAMVARLESRGVPTFRSVDRAMKLLEKFLTARA